MKRIALSVVASVLSLGILAGCSSSGNNAPAEGGANAKKSVTLKVGAVPVPHAEILELVKPLAEKEGIKIEIVEFTDYVQPNLALGNKELDANYFQHVPYMTEFAAKNKLELASVGGIHLEPLGLYSIKVKELKELKDGATVTIPADATNGGRALNLLAQNGLLRLKDGVGIAATVKDIAENKKNLQINEIDAELLPRTLEDADAAIINGNYYLEAKKNLKLEIKTLALESAKDNPYANVVTVRKGDENRAEIKTLVKLLQSSEVKQFIQSKYNGLVIPAF